MRYDDCFVDAAGGQPVLFAETGLVDCAVVTAQSLYDFAGGGVPDVDASVGRTAAGVEAVEGPTASDENFIVALYLSAEGFLEPFAELHALPHVPDAYSFVEAETHEVGAVEGELQSADCVLVSRDGFLEFACPYVVDLYFIVYAAHVESVAVEAELDAGDWVLAGEVGALLFGTRLPDTG